MTIQDVEVLRAACCIAGLDGKITDGERRLLDRLAEKAGVGSVSLTAMMDRARKDHNFYQEQFRFVHADPVSAMTAIAGVAVADGELTSDERVVLGALATKIGAKPEDLERILNAAERYVREGASRPGAAPGPPRQTG